MFMTVDHRVVESAAHGWVLDPDFLRKPGLFETLRVYSGKPFELDAHISRMRGAAKKLGIDVPDDIEDIVRREVLRAMAAGLKDAYARIVVSVDPERASSRLITVVDSLPTLQ